MDGKFLITYNENGLYSFYSDDNAEYTINLSTFGTKIVAEEIWESDYPEYYVRDIVDSNLKLKDFVFKGFSESSKTFELEIEDYIISYSSENSFATIGSKKIDYEFFISDGNARIVINGPVEENIQVQLGYYCALPIIEGQSYELTINNETLTEQCKLKNNTLYFGDYVYFLDENEEVEPEEPESETITIDSNLYSSIDSYVTFSSENETKYKIVFYKSGETEKSYLIYSKQLINAETGAASAYVGNLDIYGGGEDTGEPFFIITNQVEEGYESFIYVRESGSYILKIELYALNEVPALAGAALVSFGKKVVDGGIESIENNYGIGINSSDQNLTLPQKAISLFETELFKTGANEDKIKFNYRGILGTLPRLSSDKVSDLYNNYMEGTQGIYTDNIYIGDKNQFLSFYTKNGGKELNIQANRLLFNAGGSYTDVAEIEKAVDSKDWLSYRETEDESVIEGKTYYIKSIVPVGENLLIYPYNDTALSPKTMSGITYVDNGDLTITANGTSNKDGSDFKCSGRKPEDMPELILPNGTYWVDGNPIAGTDNNNYTTRINVGVTKNNKWSTLVYDYTEGTGVQFEVNGDDFRTDSAKVSVQAAVKNWTTVNNVVFRPRVRVVDIIYNEVTNIEPGVNPSEEGWYELKNGSSSISNYVSTHLEMKSDGLYVTKSDSGYKLKLDDLGAYIIDPSGIDMATYSTTVTIGNEKLRNVFIDEDSVDIRDAKKVLASFGETSIIGEKDAHRVEISSLSTKFFDINGSLIAELAQGGSTGLKFIEQELTTGEVLDDVNGVTFDLSNTPIGNNGHGLIVDVNICEDHARIWFESWTRGQVKTLTRNNITAVLDSSENTVKLTYSGTKQSIARKETSSAGSSFTHTLEHNPASNSTAIITLRNTKYGSVWYRFRNVDLTQDVSDYYGQFRFTYTAATRTFTAVNDQGTSCYIEIDYVAEASVIGADSYIRYTMIGATPYYTFGDRTEMDANQSPYARGARSFAAGLGLVAESENQAVFGQYNDNDSNNLLEIGNGTSDTDRSNAFAVDRYGNVELARAKVTSLSASDNVTASYLSALYDGKSVELVVSSGGTYRGVYIPDVGWMIYYDGTNTRIKNLAVDTDPCTIASGWANYTSGQKPLCRKQGNVVTFLWQCKPTSSKTIDTTRTTVCTIPEKYRPPRMVSTLQQGTGTRVFEMSVQTNGEVQVARLRNMNSTSYDTADSSFWFPLYATWIVE